MRKFNKKQEFIRFSTAFIVILIVIFCSTTQGQTTATITQDGWYRIAQNGTTLGGGNGSRAAAHFILTDKTSGQHQTVEFLAYINYSRMPSIVVLNNSYYGTSGIPFVKIRILSTANTYAGNAVEVYVNSMGNNAETFLIQDNVQTSGWTTVDWQQVSTGSEDQDGVPGGFTAHVLSLKDLVTGFVTKDGTQTSFVNGNFYTSGNILLGKTTQNNSDYKLDINGKVRANEVVVNSTGADFVFDSTYRLPMLSSVKEYIRNHGHLPDIPSASEMRKDGLFLGENQTRLLQKIEELTLYLIAQQQQIVRLRATVDTLRGDMRHSANPSKILKAIELRLQKHEKTSDRTCSPIDKTRPL